MITDNCVEEGNLTESMCLICMEKAKELSARAGFSKEFLNMESLFIKKYRQAATLSPDH
ncbi:MAG: hypothetical protein HWD61_09415 [Parachlamydiaceae bacterium]|nr:MAG: hypothetical protein HWD61_09415 [Parachlamydiaceae bacterium]